ncbi:MAG: aminoglycoside phosphotransferase [Acidimicrobiia bacterium]
MLSEVREQRALQTDGASASSPDGDPPVPLTPRPVAASLDELLAGVTRRQPLRTADAKSGSALERVTIDGEVFVLKRVHLDHDWTMRFNGDVGCHPAQVWTAGLMDVLPERIDHAVVAVATGLGRNGWGAALLMRDAGDALVPPGESLLPLEVHLQFLDDLAALSARMWGWRDTVGLVPLANRWGWFSPGDLDVEAERGWPDTVPRLAADGWRCFADRAPGVVARVVDDLRHDAGPLVTAALGTPRTFVHGDWKLGNLGRGADGRTVLIDWTYPGEAPCCYELGWYLALNRARVPHSKEDAIAWFRSSLERHGVTTDAWFERQLAVCLLGTVVIHGWEKALGDDDELGWWCDRAAEGAAFL